MFIANLHLRLYTIGWMNLNVIVSRSERPIKAVTPEIIDKVRDIDWRVKVHELLVEARHITWHSDVNFARTIGYEKAINKMGAAFVHCGLSAIVWRFQNNVWRLFQCNTDEFLHRFITMDETWIHYFTPETKEQSKQWISPDESASKKAK